MKKLSTVLLGLGLFVSSALYAAEANKSTAQQATHMGDHMHEGKMMNHMNMNGMTDEEMKKNHEKLDSMTTEEMKKMHEDMANEKTKNGMSDEEMKKMGHK
jgi:hypothetical protein